MDLRKEENCCQSDDLWLRYELETGESFCFLQRCLLRGGGGGRFASDVHKGMRAIHGNSFVFTFGLFRQEERF